MVGLNPAPASGITETAALQPVAQIPPPEPVPEVAASASEVEPLADGVQPYMAGSMPVPDPEPSLPTLVDAAEPSTASIGTPAAEPLNPVPTMDAALPVRDQGQGPDPSPDLLAGTAQVPAMGGPAEPTPILPVIAAPRPAAPIPKRTLPVWPHSPHRCTSNVPPANPTRRSRTGNVAGQSCSVPS